MNGPSRLRKAKPEPPKIPCQYACGRIAEGTLSITYTPFVEVVDSYRHGFSVTVPACRECLKAAVKVSMQIPDVK
jgi:hypothetical protein